MAERIILKKKMKLESQLWLIQGVQFMRTMRTRDGGRKLIGGAEMVPLNPFP